MSKSLLKKELITFTREELVEVILNTYDSSKEAKEYFEFFINPDADKLLETKTQLIAKEISRTRRGGYSKFRISHIRSVIKGFASFGVTSEYVARLMSSTIAMLTGHYRYYHYTETQTKGLLKLVADYIMYCDAHGMLQTALDYINGLTHGDLGTAGMRKAIELAARDAIQSAGGKLH